MKTRDEMNSIIANYNMNKNMETKRELKNKLEKEDIKIIYATASEETKMFLNEIYTEYLEKKDANALLNLYDKVKGFIPEDNIVPIILSTGDADVMMKLLLRFEKSHNDEEKLIKGIIESGKIDYIKNLYDLDCEKNKWYHNTKLILPIVLFEKRICDLKDDMGISPEEVLKEVRYDITGFAVDIVLNGKDRKAILNDLLNNSHEDANFTKLRVYYNLLEDKENPCLHDALMLDVEYKCYVDRKAKQKTKRKVLCQIVLVDNKFDKSN